LSLVLILLGLALVGLADKVEDKFAQKPTVPEPPKEKVEPRFW
jgi:hypothetical protein